MWAPLNLGIGGDRVQDLGWRLQHRLLAPSSARLGAGTLIVVLIGTNDLGAGEDPQVVASELHTVLLQLRRLQPDAHLLLHALLPRGGDHGYGTSGFHRSHWWEPGAINAHYDAIERVNAALHSFARAHREFSHFIDCGERFVRRVALPTDQLEGREVLEVPTGGGGGSGRNADSRYLDSHLMYDLLHLSPAGYEAWAACLVPEVARLLAQLEMKASGGGAVLGLGAGGSASRVAASAPACVGRSCRGDAGGLDSAR